MSDDEIKEQKLELHKIEGELSVIEHEFEIGKIDDKKFEKMLRKLRHKKRPIAERIERIEIIKINRTFGVRESKKIRKIQKWEKYK